jgi:hypothetical protein
VARESVPAKTELMRVPCHLEFSGESATVAPLLKKHRAEIRKAVVTLEGQDEEADPEDLAS